MAEPGGPIHLSVLVFVGSNFGAGRRGIVEDH
jgi:hypothetical protein